jgi:heat shock protein HslJ
VALDGIYITNIPNNPKIQVNITGGKLYILNGCNSQSSSYKADSSGTFSASLFISTKMACMNDYDYLYVNAFTNSVSYLKNGNQIILKDSSNKTSIILTPYVAPPTPVLPPAIPIFFNGNFSTNIQDTPNLLISFSNGQLSLLNGCNSQVSSYFAYSNGTFRVIGFASSAKYCSEDYDYIYTQQLSSSLSFVQSDSNHISFFDINNK